MSQCVCPFLFYHVLLPNTASASWEIFALCVVERSIFVDTLTALGSTVRRGLEPCVQLTKGSSRSTIPESGMRVRHAGTDVSA